MLNLKTIQYEIDGVSPLIQHNRRLADPRDPIVKQMKQITAKRKKTDSDHEELARLEFLGGLYCDDKGPFIPAEWIESCIRDGAKTFKQGKSAVASIFCSDLTFPLIFKGPKTAEKLFAEPKFVDSRMAKVAQARVLRTRPIFPEWSLKFSLQINGEVLSEGDVERALTNAGVVVGLGDYRPKYGRFVVKSAKEI